MGPPDKNSEESPMDPPNKNREESPTDPPNKTSEASPVDTPSQTEEDSGHINQDNSAEGGDSSEVTGQKDLEVETTQEHAFIHHAIRMSTIMHTSLLQAYLSFYKGMYFVNVFLIAHLPLQKIFLKKLCTFTSKCLEKLQFSIFTLKTYVYSY